MTRVQPLTRATVPQAAACNVGFPWGNSSSRRGGERVTALQDPGRPSFKEASSCSPFFRLCHVTWRVFFAPCLNAEFGATRIEISRKKSSLLLCLQIFHTSGFQMHFVGHGTAVALAGGSHSRDKAWKVLGKDSWHLGASVKHHRTRGQIGVLCLIRFHWASTHSGPWSSSHILADHSCCTLSILSVLSWNFFRAFLLTLHWIGTSVQYKPPPFKPKKILDEQPTENYLKDLCTPCLLCDKKKLQLWSMLRHSKTHKKLAFTILYGSLSFLWYIN